MVFHEDGGDSHYAILPTGLAGTDICTFLSTCPAMAQSNDTLVQNALDALGKVLGKASALEDQGIGASNGQGTSQTGKMTDDAYASGVSPMEAGNYDQAIADYTKAIELNPDLAWAYGSRAFLWKDMGKLTKAKADAAKARQLNPSVGAPSFFNSTVQERTRSKKERRPS